MKCAHVPGSECSSASGTSAAKVLYATEKVDVAVTNANGTSAPDVEAYLYTGTGLIVGPDRNGSPSLIVESVMIRWAGGGGEESGPRAARMANTQGNRA